ncbi:methyl-accepting chemotaxis protein [Paenibacillus frigoriresistens]|uniref:methyl-accepting chemotaxis protein n=1 Tax=Paenibacillus alginolyticus TaxID=59839 RepID=UPI0015665A54|nr:methyl-accepting chemotaxis protein [Paenibacillus frigoriresistens]NRF95578.1 methyl-accepting chemotaxis protein [Paenibacillus frigoriresistens]
MKKKTISLRKQFLTRLFVVLVMIVMLTTLLQIFLIKQQITNTLNEESNLISQSIEHGIKATDEAGQSIEHQIDLKLVSYADHISDLLGDKDWQDITNEELLQIKDKLHIAGITILAEQGDDIVGVKATDEQEIGFSFKKINYLDGYNDMRARLDGKPVKGAISYQDEQSHVLPITQSGSHDENPKFFKYAYYVKPGTHYIIDPYVEANEVYQYTASVGPNTWIKQVIEGNHYVKEIAVLNPQVFKEPELAAKLYPPKSKIVFGTFKLGNAQDTEILKDIASNSKKVNYISNHGGASNYVMFLPVDKERVIYAVLDYGKITTPLYRHSMVLVASGLIAVIALFLLTAKFFNRIYENIQRIKAQIKSLESKDFTATSSVTDNSELSSLSESANRMVKSLNLVLLNTSEQASKAQKLSVSLEKDANESVQQMYTISTEMTMYQRETVDDVLYFLDKVEESANSSDKDDNIQYVLEHIEAIREKAKSSSIVTTDLTITLSDFLTSLHDQSKETADISNALLKSIREFKLS